MCGSATTQQTDASGLTSGDLFPLGTTQLQYTTTDASSNAATCAFNITVVDTIPPTITCEDSIISGNPVVTWPQPTATDNCFGSALAQTAGPQSGSTFNLGITNVEYTVSDVAGNETTCTIVVLVDTTIGIPELSLAQKLYCYPNPTNGTVNIQVQDASLLGNTIQVLHSFGQPVGNEQTLRSSFIQLELGDQPSGLYFLRVSLPDGPAHVRVVKQ